MKFSWPEENEMSLKKQTLALLDDVTYLCRNAFPQSFEQDHEEVVKK